MTKPTIPGSIYHQLAVEEAQQAARVEQPKPPHPKDVKDAAWLRTHVEEANALVSDSIFPDIPAESTPETSNEEVQAKLFPEVEEPEAEGFLDLTALEPDVQASEHTKRQMLEKQPLGLKGQLKRGMRSAARWLGLSGSKPENVAEKQPSRIQKIVAVGAFAAVMAGALFIASKSGSEVPEKPDAIAATTTTTLDTLSANPDDTIEISETQVLAESMQSEAPVSHKQLPKYEIEEGDTPWSVLERSGISQAEIANKLSQALALFQAETGADVQRHGEDTQVWYSIDGASDTTTIMNAITPYL